MSGLTISAYERKSVLPDKWLRIIDKVVYSDWYLLAIAALVVLFWATEAMVAGFVTMLLIMSFLLVVKRDMTPCLPVLISVYCVISKGEFPPYFAYMFIILIPVAASLIFHFVYYRNEKIKAGAFGLAYLLVAASMFMGGIMSNQLNDEIKGLAFAAFLGLLPFAVYELIVNCCNGLDKKEFVRYACRAFLYLGLLITVQLLIYYIRVWAGIIPEHAEVHLGWGISNGAATVLLATMPIAMYVAVSEKNLFRSLLYAVIAVLQIIAVIATVSRGAIIVGIMEFVLMIAVSVIFNRHRKVYLLSYALVIIAIAIVCVVFKDKLIAFIERAFSNGLDGSGRDKIYEEAVNVFKQNRLFGVGFGYIGINSYLNSHPMYYFHSTFFQTIASLGMFGLVASCYMYFKRIKFAFKKARSFNVFLIVSCFGFEGYAMINTFTFLAVPGLLLIAVLTAVNERCNSMSDEEYALIGAPLPLFSHNKKPIDGVVFGRPEIEEEESADEANDVNEKEESAEKESAEGLKAVEEEKTGLAASEVCAEEATADLNDEADALSSDAAIGKEKEGKKTQTDKGRRA